jgi:hypothetical protein
MSEENEDTTGYVLVGDYAGEELVGVEHILTQLRNGSLEGRLINNVWYVKVDVNMAKKIATQPKLNPLSIKDYFSLLFGLTMHKATIVTTLLCLFVIAIYFYFMTSSDASSSKGYIDTFRLMFSGQSPF